MVREAAVAYGWLCPPRRLGSAHKTSPRTRITDGRLGLTHSLGTNTVTNSRPVALCVAR
jgi:hypothetical protein